MRISVLLLSLFFAVSAPAQITNPHTTPADVEAGSKIFRSHCASCHGPRGGGGIGANLAAGVFYHGNSDQDLHDTIKNGVPGTAMPPGLFNDTQLWQLAAFVRTLSAASTANPAHGDADAGKRLFEQNGCSGCHLVRGAGGFTGPELSIIGSQRSADYLRESILDPNAQVAPAYWVARIKTKQDKSYAGFILDQDTYTVQILDLSQGLVSLSRGDFQDFSIDKNSIMPSFKGKLSTQDLEDIVSYLSSLKRGQGASE